MEHPDDILDPRHYAKVRLPQLEAETLPPWCYTSQEFYQREVERIFMRQWIFIGRGDRIPNPGDYVTLNPVGVPVIIVRGDDGGVRAFANTCRHRGTRLTDGDGNCRAFSCPYHGWAYGLDGRLISIAGMEQTANFDKEAFGLISIRLESWDGFLFINFAEKWPEPGRAVGRASQSARLTWSYRLGLHAAPRIRPRLQLEALPRESARELSRRDRAPRNAVGPVPGAALRHGTMVRLPLRARRHDRRENSGPKRPCPGSIRSRDLRPRVHFSSRSIRPASSCSR